jgi:hypothetical protein
MTKILRAFTLFAVTVASLGYAQVAPKESLVSQQAALEAKQQFISSGSIDATTTCSFTFTSGSGNKFLKYCVTKNGNIVQFQSPLGTEFIATAPAGEGYAFCNFDTSTPYFDYAGYGDSGNWKAATTVSSSSTAVTIRRGTADGIFTLTQTITQNAGQALAQVSMTLKNNTTTSRHVGLLRFVDVDANKIASNSFDSTSRTALGYTEQGVGLQLQFVSGAFLNGAFVQDIPGGPDSCQIFTHVVSPFIGDGSMFIQYDMQLGSMASKSVAVTYKSF